MDSAIQNNPYTPPLQHDLPGTQTQRLLHPPNPSPHFSPPANLLPPPPPPVEDSILMNQDSIDFSKLHLYPPTSSNQPHPPVLSNSHLDPLYPHHSQHHHHQQQQQLQQPNPHHHHDPLDGLQSSLPPMPPIHPEMDVADGCFIPHSNPPHSHHQSNPYFIPPPNHHHPPLLEDKHMQSHNPHLQHHPHLQQQHQPPPAVEEVYDYNSEPRFISL